MRLVYRLLFSVTLFLFCFCGKSKVSDEKELRYVRNIKDIKWEELFSIEKTIRLKFPDPKDELLRIFSLAVDDAGNIFIPDPLKHRILIFDSTGKLIKQVGGKKGQGPGEFQIIRAIALDKDKNLFVYDAGNRRIAIYKFPDYEFSGSIRLDYVSDFLISPDGGLIVYSPYNQYLLSKYDSSGNLIKQTFKAKDELFRLFNCRFQLGGLADADSVFYFIYPEEFKIYCYDFNLNLLFAIKSEKEGKFRPNPPPFPRDLTPYDFSKAHEKYWDSFLHVSKVFDSGKILIVTLFKSSGLTGEENYLNVYDIDGNVYAEGLQIPDNGYVVGSGPGRIYVSIDAEIFDEQNIRPLELRIYKILLK